MRRVVLALVLSIAALGAAPQEPATVTGRVTNSQGSPPGAATVTLSGTTFTTTTDVRGRYRITGVPAGRYTISVQTRGGAYAARLVRLAPGATVTVDVVVGVREPTRRPR